jgi:hypothetical protein
LIGRSGSFARQVPADAETDERGRSRIAISYGRESNMDDDINALEIAEVIAARLELGLDDVGRRGDPSHS